MSECLRKPGEERYNIKKAPRNRKGEHSKASVVFSIKNKPQKISFTKFYHTASLFIRASLASEFLITIAPVRKGSREAFKNNLKGIKEV